MTESEMFEKSFERPKDYFQLSSESQWAIDKSLGILDWKGSDLTDDNKKRLDDHYIKNEKKDGK